MTAVTDHRFMVGPGPPARLPVFAACVIVLTSSYVHRVDESARSSVVVFSPAVLPGRCLVIRRRKQPAVGSHDTACLASSVRRPSAVRETH